MERSKGFRSKSRHKMRNGRFSIAEALQEFKQGERVLVNINPAVSTGMPHPKFQGNSGKIVSKRGRAYLVELESKGIPKKVIAKPEHLSRFKEGGSK
ncbi:MAG: 50S ribosomal protein L21e [Candidatus Undinarchaeales archaeon]